MHERFVQYYEQNCKSSDPANFSAIAIKHTIMGNLLFRKGESITDLCFVVCGSLEVIQVFYNFNQALV